MQRWSIAFWLVLLLYSGCAVKRDSIGASGYRGLSESVVKGRTTRGEVRRWLGAPSVTSRNAQGEIVWTYTKRPLDPASVPATDGQDPPAPDAGVHSRFDVILVFDKNDKVRDYSVIASQF